MKLSLKPGIALLALLAISLITACGSNSVNSTDEKLSAGISATTKRSDFGKPASAEEIKALSAELGSYFNGKNAKNPQALTGVKSATASANAASTATPMIAASNVASPVFRFYNVNTAAHFFTMSTAERDYVKNTFPFFTFEGNSFFAYPDADPTLSPVYRFYNQITGTHFFTISAEEKAYVQATWPTIFNYEGISWYASAEVRTGWVPVYRFFNTKTSTHFYTTSAAERDYVQATWSWFTYEGIAYYVLNSGQTPISGTVATGAPFPINSKVEVFDATGAIVGQTIISNADGSYNVDVPDTAQPPLIIKASADGVSTLYSVSPAITAGTVNVTPITNLIAARLSPTGNPANLATEVQAGTASVTVATTTAKVQEIMTALAPVTAALSDTTNPLTGAFSANGTGHDQLLDAVKIQITPTLTGSTQGANIDVTVVTQQPSGAAPIVIPTFSATAAAVPPLSTASIPVANLVVAGTSTKVRDLVTQMQTCYALPVTDRITLNGTLASDITAAACRGLFSNNDPATYKQNGFVVSSTSQFSGIFKATSTGALFDLGNYEFTRTNGDIVFSYRSRSADAANTTYNIGVARLEGAQLKLIGNQWNYDAGIKPTVANRTLSNDPTYSWQATGYNIFVANKVVGGNSIFNKVVVTSPDGTLFTLKPTSGLSYMVLESSPGVLTVSNIVFLNGNALGSQSLTQITTKETGQFWSNFGYWTDTQISSLSQRSVWKYDFYLAGNATATPNSTEYRSTYERAPTVAELKAITFAKFTDTFINSTRLASAVAGSITFGAPKATQMIEWEVPAGALEPVQGFMSGRAPYISSLNLGNRFDDTVNFGSSARTANIACATQSLQDLHCNADGNFAVGTRFNYLHVKAISPRFMDVFSQLGLYKPSLN